MTKSLEEFEAELESIEIPSEPWLAESQKRMPLRAVPEVAVEQESAPAASKETKDKPALWFAEDEVAARFAATLDQRVVGVLEWNAWASFDEATGTWRKQPSEAFVSLKFKEWARSVYAALQQDATAKDRQRFEQFFNVTPRRRVLSSAFEELNVESQMFDRARDELLVANGVVDLRTGELREAVPQDFWTKRSRVKYRRDATSPVWDAILNAFPADTHDYLRVMVGQALTGYQPTNASVLFFHGGGKNGKSTFLNVLRAIAGDFGADPSPTVLTGEHAGGAELMVFKGLRLALFEELPNSKFLNAQVLKRLTGTEVMRARQLYQQEEEFTVMATNMVATNFLPVVSEVDEGTWRRLKVIRAPYRYKPAADCSGPMDRPEIANLKTLAASDEVLEAALAWAVSGAVEWYEAGQVEPPAPLSVQDAVAEWRGDNDKVGSWLLDAVEADASAFVLIQDAYDDYCEAMKEQGRGRESLTNFVNLLKQHPYLEALGGEYVKRARHRRLTQSTWSDPEKAARFSTGANAYMPRIAGEVSSFVKGVRFKGSVTAVSSVEEGIDAREDW